VVPKFVSFPYPGGFFSEKHLSIPFLGGGTVATGTSGGDSVQSPPDASFRLLKIGWLFEVCHTKKSHGKQTMERTKMTI
jgi:hypothetical protein